MTKSDLVTVEMKLLQETERGEPNEGAFLVWDGETLNRGRRHGIWIPKKLVEREPVDEYKKIHKFTMPEWLAIKKRLI